MPNNPPKIHFDGWAPNCDKSLPACIEMFLWKLPSGIFIVNKQAGPSSFGVVRSARRQLNLKKIGHAGTLDPMATGVLVLATNKATKLLGFLEKADKSYRAELTLGEQRDSYDSTGNITESKDASHLTPEIIEQALDKFRGNIEQLPPMHSAIKVDGVRLYKLARKGVTVKRKIRNVTISHLKLLEFTPGCKPIASIDITCSKGTYIRSLIHDIGSELGVGAHMSALVRTRVGPFGISIARDEDDISNPKNS